MTTKTTITLSPIKRCHGSPNLKKRRPSSYSFIHRKQPTNLSFILPTMTSQPAVITVSCEKSTFPSTPVPDLIHDVLIVQHQRRETIVDIATMLRKVGDQIDEELQINNTSSSSIDDILNQRSATFVHCLSRVLRFFL